MLAVVARLLDQLMQDVRYAVRGLRRSPGFAAAVVLTLGLGIGANAAMFGVLDQLMLRPYRYLRDPASVDRVYLRIPGARRLNSNESFPYARYLDLANGTTSFSQAAAFFPVTVAVGTGEASREQPIAAVSASYFNFFNASPVVGRYFTAAEDTTPVGAPVAVLGYAYWQSELGGRDVLGQSIQVDNFTATIIGVAPRGFTGVADAGAPAVFVPITTFGGHQPGGSSVEYWRRYNWDWAQMMLRRKPGVTRDQASADLTLAFIRSRERARAIHSWMPRVDPARPVATAGALKVAAGPYPGLEARTLLWVTGVALIVLLIACANVADLFFARALRRRREIALRRALGVSRGRLIAQSLTESLVLSLLGGATGIVLAQWGGLALRRLMLPDAGALDLGVDWRTLAMAFGTAIAAGVVTSFAPLLLAERADITSTLKSGMREGTYQRSRLRSTLLVCQGAMSVVLLVGAGLFVRSLDRVRDLRLGYDVSHVLMARWQRRGAAMTSQERAAFGQRLLEAARKIPGVDRAALVSNVPLEGTATMSLFVPGIDSVSRLGRFTYQTASADYFDVMGTRIVRGRSFSSGDALGAPKVVIVSESMARTLWPKQDALGQCIRAGADSLPCSTVVGVAEDAAHDPVADQRMRFYLPLDQNPGEGGSLVVLRARSRPELVAESVRRTLQSIMPGQQYVTVQPMARLLDAQRRSWQVGATMFVAFGVLALVVAAVGLYGVIAYMVAQRMHELGVRIALGARSADVARLVMGEGLRLATTGVAVGGLVALGGSRWIQPLLFQQSAKDPAVLTVVSVLLLSVAAAATAIPAWRATRADPNVVLRSE